MKTLPRHFESIRQIFLLLIMSSLLAACVGGTDATHASTAKAITAFSLHNRQGVISGHDIMVDLPWIQCPTHWPVHGGIGPECEHYENSIATFTTTGETVTVNGVLQVSGVTENNFATTEPVIYIVTAADVSSTNYTVHLSADGSFLN